jgi:Cu+-exporting ATPase
MTEKIAKNAKKGKDVKKCPECTVCKKEISDNTAKYVTDHEGQKYYFCSGGCMREFSSGPDAYIED